MLNRTEEELRTLQYKLSKDFQTQIQDLKVPSPHLYNYAIFVSRDPPPFFFSSVIKFPTRILWKMMRIEQDKRSLIEWRTLSTIKYKN